MLSTRNQLFVCTLIAIFQSFSFFSFVLQCISWIDLALIRFYWASKIDFILIDGWSDEMFWGKNYIFEYESSEISLILEVYLMRQQLYNVCNSKSSQTHHMFICYGSLWCNIFTKLKSEFVIVSEIKRTFAGHSVSVVKKWRT